MSSKGKSTAATGGASALVPKLRFPEFQGATSWSEMTLGAAATINPPHSGLPEKFVYIDLELVEAGALKEKKRILRIGAPSRAQRFLERGDIIYQVVRPYQRNNLLCDFDCKEDYVASTGYAQLRAKGNNHFLYHSVHTDVFVDRVIAKCTGSNYPAINSSDLAEIHLPLPPTLPEQQKIAECLDSADALIAAQGRKVEALKAHKKGLMQQLFPQEGETQPRLRFPEFEGAEGWGSGELGPKTEKVGSGITPSGGDRNYKQAGRPFVRSQNVGWGELLLDDVAFLDEETHSSFDSTEIRLGDVLLNITGASIGRSAVADSRVVGGNVNQHVCIIRVKSDDLNRAYLNQYLISQVGQKQIDSFQAGGNRQGLNFAQIRSFRIPLPPVLAEQKRIAECLTSLDDLIAAETRKLNTLKSHKKGLMQQLFPQAGDDDA